jgi:hypothetical protein
LGQRDALRFHSCLSVFFEFMINVHLKTLPVEDMWAVKLLAIEKNPIAVRIFLVEIMYFKIHSAWHLVVTQIHSS